MARPSRAWRRAGAPERFMDGQPGFLPGPVAYFSMEFGLHESLGMYSGGLGVLAGDHCKAASDLGLPLFGVGLLYRSGYFRQTVDADGFQQHIYPDYDFARLPVLPVRVAVGRTSLRPRRSARPGRSRPRLGGPGRRRSRLLSRYRQPLERSLGSGHHRAFSTFVAGRCASPRRSSSGSEACAPCGPWEFSPRCGT